MPAHKTDALEGQAALYEGLDVVTRRVEEDFDMTVPFEKQEKLKRELWEAIKEEDCD